MEMSTENKNRIVLPRYETVKLNGVNIKEFTVVAKDIKEYDFPIYTITAFFAKYSGEALPVVNEAEICEGHKIILGGKKIDGTDYSRFETEIWYKDGDLHLGCANATMAQKTIYTFIDQYFDDKNSIEVELTDGAVLFNSTEPDNWDDANPADILSIQDRILRSCYKLQAILEYEHSIGKYYTYQNHGYVYSVPEARETDNRTTNCVIADNWVLMDAGLITHGIYNIVYDGTTGYQFEMGTDEGSALKFFSENMKLIDMRPESISVRRLYNSGRLYPGDLILFQNHMQITLPHLCAFDAGRSNTEEVSRGSKFKWWAGPNPCPSCDIGFIFRDKNALPK